MWTLISRTVEKNLQAKVPGERLMMHVTTVWEQGEETVEVPFTIENLELMERTILSISDRLNNLEPAIQEANSRPIMPERPVEPAPVPPTAEQLKEMEIAQKEAELAQEVERARVRELAKTDRTLATKLSELDALKTAPVTKK
jgi:hypothetical protein